MGISQITAGMYAKKDKLALEQLKQIGFIKTHSADKRITDSAAGATAFSIGRKSYNSAIGVDADTVPHKTIMETAQEKGLGTAVVVTSQITHATPACFYAHQPQRYMYEAIAADFCKSKVQIAMGGGKEHFNNRKDGLNLVDSLKAKGFSIPESLEAAASGGNKFVYFVSDTAPIRFSQGRGSYLPKASNIALDKLSKNEKGFFLHIEGSQIDWGGHANNADWVVDEMLDFDHTIATVLEFAKRDQNTLVVITADHETGGFALNTDLENDNSWLPGWTTGSHTAVMVPVFAYGPGSEDFQGIYENTEIYHKMMNAFGWN